MAYWWIIVPAILGALLSILVAGVGFGQGWGASQWGPVSAWLSSALTFGAVSIALWQAFRGQRESLKAERSRLIDHELTRRRENLSALSDLWAALMVMAMPALKFQFYFENLPQRFDANMPRTDLDPDATDQPLAFEVSAQYDRFFAKWTETVEPPLFVALAMLQGTPLDEAITHLNHQLADFKTKELPKLTKTMALGVRPDTSSVRDAWSKILGLRQAHLDLARKRFSLDFKAVEADLRN